MVECKYKKYIKEFHITLCTRIKDKQPVKINPIYCFKCNHYEWERKGSE